MKRTLSALLALCLLAALIAPAMAEEPVSAAVEAPVGEAWTAGAGNGLSVDGGNDFAAWSEDAAGFAVSAPEEDGVPVVGPDAEVQELGEAALTELTGEDAFEAVETVEEIVEPVCDADLSDILEGFDSDALFAAHARRILYGTGRRVLMATDSARRNLTGKDRALYDALKPMILGVANGTRASTSVTISVSELLGKTCFSASELGVNIEYDENNAPTQASLNALSSAIGALFSYSTAMNALWSDCAYELFWLDLYKNRPSVQRSSYYRSYSKALNDTIIRFDNDATYTIAFPVLADYAGEDLYTADAAKLSSVSTAAANARSIVGTYADCSDYVKLYGYAYEICRRVQYNYEAASGTWDMTDQNPWKLIWVFDGDTTTNVVCEGYAMAFSYLCELSSFNTGVRCIMVSGTATGPHAWNIVRMSDGNNYLVDVTWMDGNWANSACDSMAGWISQKEGHSLFLAGGTGSVQGGYTVNYRTSSSASFRTYDASTLGCHSAANLALASAPYTLNGFQSVGGDTYYFDDGVYVTGERTIGGTVYDFGADGVLQGTWPADVHVHTVETLPAVPATCTASGLFEGKRCSVCDAVLIAQDVEPPLGHAWSYTYTWDDQLTSVTAVRTCQRAGCAETETETSTAITSEITKAATCTQRAQKTYTVTFQNSAFYPQTKAYWTGAAPTHDWGDATYTWSDDNSKVTATRACRREGCTATESEEADVTSGITTPPTCTEMGQTTYSAAFANVAFEAQVRVLADIPAPGHDLVHHDAEAPTCTEVGWSAYDTCSRCDYTTYSEIPALKHDLVHHDAKAPTCTEVGWNAYDTCSRCDYTTYSELPALKHDLVHHDAKAPTCTEVGWSAYDTCNRAGCGYTTYSEIPAPGHSLTAHARVDATYAAPGTQAYWECSACHALFSDAQAATRIPRPVLIPARTSTAAEAVIAMIDALPDTADKAAVEAARAAYDALPDEEKMLVNADRVNRLTDAERQAEAAEAQRAAEEQAAAEAQRAAEEARAAEAKAAEEARAAAQKKAAEDKAAADAVIEKINALPATAGTSDKAGVEAARAAYDALSDEEKALVNADKVNRLTDAERQVDAAEAQKTAADKAAANAVIEKIAELPATAGTSDKAAVEAARAAYDALTDDQKALVSAEAVSRLTLSESQVKAAEEAAAKIKLTKSNTKVTVKAQAWTGKALKPKVTVKLNGKALKKGTDYKVSYKNNTDIGKARVTVTGVGKYTGTVTVSFIINPKVVSGLSLKAGAGKLTASWKKVSGVTGYQIQYGLKSSFKGAKKVTVKKAATVKKVLKQLTTGKAYYVRIRAYKKVDKKPYWSDWSKAVKSGKIR